MAESTGTRTTEDGNSIWTCFSSLCILKWYSLVFILFSLLKQKNQHNLVTETDRLGHSLFPPLPFEYSTTHT